MIFTVVFTTAFAISTPLENRDFAPTPSFTLVKSIPPIGGGGKGTGGWKPGKLTDKFNGTVKQTGPRTPPKGTSGTKTGSQTGNPTLRPRGPFFRPGGF